MAIRKLGRAFLKALHNKDVVITSDSEDPEEKTIKFSKGEIQIRGGLYIEASSAFCCGITEFDFTNMCRQLEERLHKLPDSVFNTLVAGTITKCKEYNDARIEFVGIPTKYSDAFRFRRNPNYTLKFYKRLRKSLNELGFTELPRRPYKNNNSTNWITVFAAQANPKADRNLPKNLQQLYEDEWN